MIYQTRRSTVGKKSKLAPGERATELEDADIDTTASVALEFPQGGGIKSIDVSIRLIVVADAPFALRCCQILVDQSVVISRPIRCKHLRDWIALAVRLDTQIFGQRVDVLPRSLALR